jgi:RNA polymerase sigma factor (sigma-70 family)
VRFLRVLLTFNHGDREQRSTEPKQKNQKGSETMNVNTTTGAMTALNNADTVATALQAIDIDTLYRSHKQQVHRFVLRYVRNSEDAEDVVQNTFIEAMRCADRFAGLSKPSTWLFGIALNLARNHVRRNCASRCDAIDEVSLEQVADPHADPALQIELRQIATKVEALLSQLQPKIRSTFEAVLDGETTYEEAAGHLDIPVGTVRSRVSRVRAAVRAECRI